MSRRVFKGIGASEGVGAGRCLLLKSEARKREETGNNVEPSRFTAPQKEIKLLESAIARVEDELKEIKARVDAEEGKDAAEILEAQLLMLKDPLFIDEIEKRIQTQRVAAKNAVGDAALSLNRRFSSLPSKRMRERGEDVVDLGSRIVDALSGRREKLEPLCDGLAADNEKVVLVSHKLAAATVAEYGRRFLAGIVSETGSKTSHLAIVARSLKIPAVLAVTDITKQLNKGDRVIVDADRGAVILNPSEHEAKIARTGTQIDITGVSPICEPTLTIDGHRIQLFANVADLESVKEASVSGAEGIGLFRTEFLYFDRAGPPTEDELYETMKQTISMMGEKTIVVRTLDIGGDKKPSYIEFEEEENPALGLRGIRFSLRNTSLLETQLAAILRASAEGNIWVMFPMISSVRELREAKRVTEGVKHKLEKRNVPFNARMKIGIMIETPSAALTADVLASEADFFSIGTNDLVQYVFAADRENENAPAAASTLDPSVLKLISQTISSAHEKNIHVGMCGDMASDLDAIPILLGFGIDELSSDSKNLQIIRRSIQSLTFSETKTAALETLSLDSAEEVRELSQRRFPRQLASKKT